MNRLPAPEVPPWLASMLPFDRYLVQVGAYRMHVMEQGEKDALPVLMLHGNPTWGFLWRKVAEELRGHRLRPVMPDLIGLGLSEKPVDGKWHTLERHGHQVAELIDALGLKRFVLVVQDWGGPIAGAALSVLPDGPSRVAGAVILNTALSAPTDKVRSTAFHRFARLPLVSELVFRQLSFPQAVLFTAQGDKRSIRGDVARAYRWPLREHHDNAAPLALARMVPDSVDHPSVPYLRRSERAWAQIAASHVPVELVWGERDPILGRALKRTRAMFPDAKVTVTQAGHFLQEEVPREIADAILHVSAA